MSPFYMYIVYGAFVDKELKYLEYLWFTIYEYHVA